MSDQLGSIQKKFYRAGYLVFLLILIYVGLKIIAEIQQLVIILIASIFLAYILIPLVKFFENPIKFKIPSRLKVFNKNLKLLDKEKTVVVREKGFRRLTSIIIVYLILLIILSVIYSFVAPKISSEYNNLVNNFPQLSQQATNKFNELVEWIEPRLPPRVREIITRTIAKFTAQVETYAYNVATYTFGIAQKVVSTALAILVIPIFTFYILMDLESFKRGFKAIIPEHRQEEISNLFHEIDRLMGRYVRGQILISFLLFVMITIVLLILDIDYAFLIGLLSGIVNIIPYLGVIIGMVPAILLALIGKGLIWAILVFAVLEAIQMLESQLISPAIMGEAVGLPPLLVILAIVIGGQLLGIIGMLIAIPIAAIIRVIFQYYIELGEEKKKKTGTRIESSAE